MHDIRWHIAIDTAGFNTPITLDKFGSPSKSIHLDAPEVIDREIWATQY